MLNCIYIHFNLAIEAFKPPFLTIIFLFLEQFLDRYFGKNVRYLFRLHKNIIIMKLYNIIVSQSINQHSMYLNFFRLIL
jgi:hypothetical protein